MKKIALITFNLLLAAFFIASLEWLEHEQAEIESITSEYKATTYKLEKIAEINKWFDDVMAQSVQKEGDFKVSDENLITFFDANKELYSLLIEKYIYQEESVKKMGLSYGVALNNTQKISNIMDLNYKEGFLQLKEMKISGGDLVGKFDVIQPQVGDTNASKR